MNAIHPLFTEIFEEHFGIKPEKPEPEPMEVDETGTVEAIELEGDSECQP